MAKRARMAAPEKPLEPEDITVGLSVAFWGDRRGFVSDAFAPLDQFWIRDAVTDEVVRDPEGDIVAFSAKELRSTSPPAPAAGGEGPASARVLVIGTEQQMVRVIQHFGPPDAVERREPQMLLAVPCSSCSCGPGCSRFDPEKPVTCDRGRCPLLKLAVQGINDVEGIRALADTLRPDLAGRLGIRAYHLKQAVEQIGPDLQRLDGYYCLSSVTLPFGLSEIEASFGLERRTMEDLRCHIDLGVTAEGPGLDGEASLDRTAKRVLGEACGISLSETLWEEEVQFKLRKMLKVDVPLKYWDGPGVKGFILILPSDVEAVTENGLLAFREPAGAAYLGSSERPPARGGAALSLAGGGEAIGGKTINEWKAEQGQFRHLPRLPEGWIRIRSRNNDQVYFYNTQTRMSQFEHPLPEGWTREKSKSTGKVYYFNAKKRRSMFEIPAE